MLQGILGQDAGEFVRIAFAHVLALMLYSIRIISFFAVFPLFNQLNSGRLIVNCVGVALALPLVEQGAESVLEQRELTALFLATVAIKEVVCGLFLGLLLAVPLWAVQMAGEILDQTRGIMADSSQTPVGRGAASTMSIFLGLLTTVLLALSGALELIIGLIYRSFAIWPLWVLLPAVFEAGQAQAVGALLDQVVRYALVMAGPMLIMFLATALAGMMLARSAQQIVTEQVVSLIKNILFVALSAGYVLLMSGYVLELFAQFETLGRSFPEGRTP